VWRQVVLFLFFEIFQIKFKEFKLADFEQTKPTLRSPRIVELVDGTKVTYFYVGYLARLIIE